MNITFRPYSESDYQSCMGIFDTNCPAYFAPNEREDYEKFLEPAPEGYEVCEVDGRILGAFGLLGGSRREKRLNWIMLAPTAQGMGVGSKIMERVIHQGRASDTRAIAIATSQMIAPFFERYGATTSSITKDGHGPGIDRVNMVLSL